MKNHIEEQDEDFSGDFSADFTADFLNEKFKTSELINFNNILDTRVQEESNERIEQEQLLIQESKLSEMGEIIGMIAHQWRQPLTALGTITQNIHLKYSLGKLDQEYMDSQMLLSNALTEKMSKTIEDFRNFFKVKKEKHVFPLQHSIEQTISLIGESFKSNCIKITNHISDDAIIYGIESELSQVLLNIIINSRDTFSEKKIKNPCINIRTKRSDRKIQIFISDNAGGIEEQTINKIFEPYFTTKDNYNGVGLGLYMSKMIIEKNMNGKLTVKNMQDGVEFSISLPLN